MSAEENSDESFLLDNEASFRMAEPLSIIRQKVFNAC